MSESVKRIGRPRQLYIGHKVRNVIPINERNQAPISSALNPGQRTVWSPLKRRENPS